MSQTQAHVQMYTSSGPGAQNAQAVIAQVAGLVQQDVNKLQRELAKGQAYVNNASFSAGNAAAEATKRGLQMAALGIVAEACMQGALAGDGAYSLSEQTSASNEMRAKLGSVDSALEENGAKMGALENGEGISFEDDHDENLDPNQSSESLSREKEGLSNQRKDLESENDRLKTKQSTRSSMRQSIAQAGARSGSALTKNAEGGFQANSQRQQSLSQLESNQSKAQEATYSSVQSIMSGMMQIAGQAYSVLVAAARG